jgi:hypothetical protein
MSVTGSGVLFSSFLLGFFLGWIRVHLPIPHVVLPVALVIWIEYLKLLAMVWNKPNGTHYHLMKWQLTIPDLTHSIGYYGLWCPIPTSFQPYSVAG